MQIVTIKELSELLKVKPKTLYQWAELRQIPHVKMNGALRFEMDDIIEWLKSCKKRSGINYNPFTKPTVPERKVKK
jgi:excisionase family DNA binding protein